MAKIDYTKGNIATTMLKTACAMLASTLAMSGYNIVDTFFVGKIGDETPLAAMGYTFPVVMFIGCIFHGYGGGCMATMAHAIGRKDMEEARRLVSTGVRLLVGLAVLLASIGILTSDFAFGSMGAQGTTLLLVKQYMNIWFIGCVTSAIGMEGNKILIATGYPRLSSAMTILGMLINTFLDPFFIFGGRSCIAHITSHCVPWLASLVSFLLSPLSLIGKMGIAGAALATVLSQAVTAIVILGILYRANLLSFHKIGKDNFSKCARLITQYAIPAILGMLLFPISNYVMTWVTSKFGDTAVAGIASASRMENVAFVFPMAFGITLMPIIAQNFGARLYSRVRFCFKFAVTVAFCFLTTINIALFIWGDHIAPLLTPVVGVQEVISQYMKIIPFGFAALEITRFCGFLMVGCGHPFKDTIFKSVRIICIMFPMILVTALTHWYDGIFFSRLVTDVLGGCLMLAAAWHTLHQLPKEDLT